MSTKTVDNSMPISKAEKLKKLLEVANQDVMSLSDAQKIILTLVQSVQKLKKDITDEAEARVKKLDSTESQLRQQIKEKTDQMEGDNSRRLLEAKNEISKQLQVLKIELESKIPPEKDLTDIYTQLGNLANKINDIVIPDVELLEDKIINNLPKYGEKYRDALELLQDDERLDITAIKGLTDKINELKQEVAKKTSGGVRRVFQPYIDRFTDQTDGTTKIFYLSREPLKTDTIEVFGTDFPIILDPTVDFSVVGKKLTLADSVPAPSAGSTLIIKYYA